MFGHLRFFPNVSALLANEVLNPPANRLVLGRNAATQKEADRSCSEFERTSFGPSIDESATLLILAQCVP
jgi:hypothetical protein